MKLVKYLFYLSAVVFPLGLLVSLRLAQLPDVRIVFLDLLTGVIVMVWFIKNIQNRVMDVRKSLGLFIGVAALSLLVNVSKYELWQLGIGALYLLRFTAYTGLLYVLKDLRFQSRRILIWLGVSVAGLGLVQYWLYPNLRNLQYLGWDPHLDRLFGTFLDPQFTGIILVLTLLLLISKKTGSRRIKGVYIGIVGAALFLTFSRSSYLALLIGMTVFYVNNKKQLQYLVRIIALGLIAIIFLVLVNNSGLVGQNLLRGDTVTSRIDSWKQAIVIWRQSPVLGVGFNTYRYTNHIKIRSLYDHAGAGADNSFLFVLATTGVLGLFTYFIYWGNLIKRVGFEGLAIISALFAHAMFNNTLFYPWVLWWIAVYFSSPRGSS